MKIKLNSIQYTLNKTQTKIVELLKNGYKILFGDSVCMYYLENKKVLSIPQKHKSEIDLLFKEDILIYENEKKNSLVLNTLIEEIK